MWSRLWSIVFEYYAVSRINILLLFGSFILLYNLYWFSFADIIIQFQLLYIFSVKTFFLKVRLLLDYSDLHKNLSKFHKIAILWSYCSHKFSPIPIKLLLLFVEIDHHIQYLWFMQLVGSFPWMICLKQVVSSHQKNVYHFNGLVDNSLCRPIKLILAKNDISYTIPLCWKNIQYYSSIVQDFFKIEV